MKVLLEDEGVCLVPDDDASGESVAEAEEAARLVRVEMKRLRQETHQKMLMAGFLDSPEPLSEKDKERIERGRRYTDDMNKKSGLPENDPASEKSSGTSTRSKVLDTLREKMKRRQFP